MAQGHRNQGSRSGSDRFPTPIPSPAFQDPRISTSTPNGGGQSPGHRPDPAADAGRSGRPSWERLTHGPCQDACVVRLHSRQRGDGPRTMLGPATRVSAAFAFGQETTRRAYCSMASSPRYSMETATAREASGGWNTAAASERSCFSCRCRGPNVGTSTMLSWWGTTVGLPAARHRSQDADGSRAVGQRRLSRRPRRAVPPPIRPHPHTQSLRRGPGCLWQPRPTKARSAPRSRPPAPAARAAPLGGSPPVHGEWAGSASPV